MDPVYLLETVETGRFLDDLAVYLDRKKMTKDFEMIPKETVRYPHLDILLFSKARV